MTKRRRRRTPVDVISFLESHERHPATDIEEFRAFQAVFLDGGATQEQGLIVLNAILGHCGLFNTPLRKGAPSDTHMTYLAIGKGDVGRWLLAKLTTEQSQAAAPTRTESQPPKERDDGGS